MDPISAHHAVLSVVLLTDEDDCSASNPQLFDNTQTDINDRTTYGVRHNCVPRDDVSALLYPMDRYVNQLLSLRQPGRLVVAAIAGPVTESAGGTGYDVEIQEDDLNYPFIEYTCTTATDGAAPGVRIRSFVSALNTPTALNDWAYSSICDSSYTGPLQGIGLQIGQSF